MLIWTDEDKYYFLSLRLGWTYPHKVYHCRYGYYITITTIAIINYVMNITKIIVYFEGTYRIELACFIWEKNVL